MDEFVNTKQIKSFINKGKYDLSCICIDIETTGLSKVNDDIIQISIIDNNEKVLLDKIYRPTSRVYFLQNSLDINEVNSSINKLEDDYLFLQYLFDNSRIILGFNSNKFDIPFIEYKLNLKIDKSKLKDLMIDVKTNLCLNDNTLNSVAQYCGVINEKAHDALYDVITTLKCYKYLLPKFTPFYKQGSNIVKSLTLLNQDKKYDEYKGDVSKSLTTQFHILMKNQKMEEPFVSNRVLNENIGNDDCILNVELYKNIFPLDCKIKERKKYNINDGTKLFILNIKLKNIKDNHLNSVYYNNIFDEEGEAYITSIDFIQIKKILPSNKYKILHYYEFENIGLLPDNLLNFIKLRIKDCNLIKSKDYSFFTKHILFYKAFKPIENIYSEDDKYRIRNGMRQPFCQFSVILASYIRKYNIENNIEYKQCIAPTKSSQMQTFNLTNEQQELIDYAKQGNNVLVDACIGSGKTTSLQHLVVELKKLDKKILYLTYNATLKNEARTKIKSDSLINTQGFDAYAYEVLKKNNLDGHLVKDYLNYKDEKKISFKKFIDKYDVLIIDEYQDIEEDKAEFLEDIKKFNPNIQIIAVGDIDQRINEYTNLDVISFIHNFMNNNYKQVFFTTCFRLNKTYAEEIGNIWGKQINGINPNLQVLYLNPEETINFLKDKDTKDILCLGGNLNPELNHILNTLENNYQDKFNRDTVFAKIGDDRGKLSIPSNSAELALFLTFDSCKGMERKYCVVCGFTKNYWDIRADKGSKFNILKNKFLVAASRGKETIIFVKPKVSKDKLLQGEILKEVLCSPFEQQEEKNFNVNNMYEYRIPKLVRKVENCIDYKIIKKPISDFKKINIKTSYGTIDISSAISSFIKINYFKNYNIDTLINFLNFFSTDNNQLKISKSEPIQQQLLDILAFETSKDRYRTQVPCPYLNEEQIKYLYNLMKSFKFNKNAVNDKEIQVGIEAEIEKIGIIRGQIDAIQNNNIIEFKYKKNIETHDFLQIGTYLSLKNYKKGLLYNLYDESIYEIRIKDKKKFLDSMTQVLSNNHVRKCKINKKRNKATKLYKRI